MTRTFVALLALAFAPAAAQEADRQAAPRPNVVLLLADDLGWGDLGCYGSAVCETPSLDALAAGGLRFTDAYANAPNCAPSRAALQSGQYAPRTGVYTVNSSARGKAKNRRLVPTPNTTVLADEVVTLAEALGAAGYDTAFLGKWHLGDDPTTQGYRVNVGGSKAGHPKRYHRPYGNVDLGEGPEGEYLTDRLTDEAIAFLDEERDGPFFLHLAYYTVHTPLHARADLLEAAQARHEALGADGKPPYTAMVAALDESVGRLLAALDERYLAEDTLVLFTSDNGGHGNHADNGHLRGSKGMLYEGGIRVPLLARWPGHVPAGAVTDAPAIGVDVYPTLLELAGAPTPDGHVLDGASLADVLAGGEAPARALFWHFPAYLEPYAKSQGTWRETPSGAIRRDRWKLIERFEDGRVELFDLAADPGEARDLAAERPDVAATMQRELAAWRRVVGAPVPTEPEPAYAPPAADG